MATIISIALYTLKQHLRTKVYFVIIIFGFMLSIGAMVISSIALGQRTSMLLNIGLGGIDFLALISVVFAMVNLVLEEIESKTIYLILARPIKKSNYLFSIASIQFRRLDQVGVARKTALEAASLNPKWGRPYMLIGDMYGSTARNCGDSWNQRLAILAAMDKYSHARSIDPEVAEEANDKLSRYRGSMPSQDEGFMRGLKEGQTVDVGCWIGEKVKVRYN